MIQISTFQDLLLFVTVDSANDTVLYTRDVMSARQSPATAAVFEDLGPIISIKMIDLDVLQPEYPSKYFRKFIRILICVRYKFRLVYMDFSTFSGLFHLCRSDR